MSSIFIQSMMEIYSTKLCLVTVTKMWLDSCCSGRDISNGQVKTDQYLRLLTWRWIELNVTFWSFSAQAWHCVKNQFAQGKWVSVCLSLTCDKWDTTDLILMKLQGVVHHTALAFSKLLCLAQGGGSNYLANILITSHISHTAGGIKWNLEHISNYPCSTNLSPGPTVCNILDFPLFWVASKPLCPPGYFFPPN